MMEERGGHGSFKTPPYNYGYDEELYVERTFRFQTIRREIFKQDSPSFVLFVTNVTRSELKSWGVPSRKIHSLDAKDAYGIDEQWINIPHEKSQVEHEDLFKKLCQRHKSGKPVHWVYLLKGALVWKKCSGQIGCLIQFLCNRHNSVTTPHLEHEIIGDARVVIVADSPGSGKSNLLVSLSKKLIHNFPDKMLFKFDLKIFMAECENRFCLRNIVFMKYEVEEALEMVASMVNFDNPLAKIEFKHRCRDSTEVVLMFDGFDEINRECQEKVVKLLKLLKNETQVQILVTTRYGEKLDLEVHLDTLSIGLGPLTKKQKLDYLDKYLKKKLKEVLYENQTSDLEQFKGYIEGILVEIEDFMVTVEKEKHRVQILMLSNSLSHIVSMIKNCKVTSSKFIEDIKSAVDDKICSLDFSNYVKILLKSVNVMSALDRVEYTSLPLYLSMVAEIVFETKLKIPCINGFNDIFEGFIEVKLDRFYVKKRHCPYIGSIYSSPEFFALKEISLELLLPDETSTISLSWHEKVEQQLMEEIDLIVRDGTSFQFKHQTLAEYFFFEWVVSDLTNEEVQKVLVKRILIEPNCSIVRRFLNHQILNKQISIALTDKVIGEMDIFKLCDSSGTFLHLLSEECLGSIMEMFTKAFPYEVACIILETNFNLQNVLHVACELSHDEVVRIILTFAKNHLPGEQTEKLILQKDCWDESPFGLVYGKSFVGLFIDFLHDNNRKIDDEVCSYLLELNLREADCNILTRSFLTDSPDSVEKVFELAYSKFSRELYRELIIDQIDIHGNTSLLNLAFCGRIDNLFQFWDYAEKTLNEDSLRLYLQQTNASGNSVLHQAALGSNAIVFHQLLQYAKILMTEPYSVGQFLLSVNVEKNTVLHEAVSESDIDFLQQLFDIMDEEMENENLKNFATQANKSQNTVLHLAALRNEAEIMKQLYSYLKDILKGDELQKILLASNFEGYSCFQSTVREGNVDVLKVMWDFADELNKDVLKEWLVMTNKCGDTVYHSATARPGVEILKFLWEYAMGILPKSSLTSVFKQANGDGNTVFHLSALNGSVEISNCWFNFANYSGGRNVVKEAIQKLNADGDNILHLAVNRGEMAVILQIYTQAKNLLGDEFLREFLFKVDSSGNTVLHLAIIRGAREILSRFLVLIGSELDTDSLKTLATMTNIDGSTIIHLGIEASEPQVLEVLFDFFRSFLSESDIEDLLVKLNVLGKTALQLAYDRNDFDAITHLCEAAKEALSGDSLVEFLTKINSFGETFLHLAVHLEEICKVRDWCNFVKTHFSATLCEKLFATPNQNGDTVLHYVVRLRKSDFIIYWFDFAKEVLSLDILKAIIEKSSASGESILHLASSVGDINAAKYLCQYSKQFQGEESMKETLQKCNKNGEPVLHYVVRKSELSTVKFWLDFVKQELGTDYLSELLPQVNGAGESVLHIAVVRDDVDIVKLLCECAKEVLGDESVEEFFTQKVKNGSNILHYIVTRGNVIMMKEFWEYCVSSMTEMSLEKFVLQTNGGDENILHLAASRGKVSILNQTFVFIKDSLCKESVKDMMMKRNFEGNVNLHIAASKGRMDIISHLWDWHNELLSEDSCDEFILSTTSSGCTILHLAVSRSEIIFLNKLLEWCEEKLTKDSLRILVLLPNKHGSTCLHLAINEGETVIVNRIFEYAKCVLEDQQLASFFKKPNEDKDTVFHLSLRRGKLSITMYLCEYAKQVLSAESLKRLLTRPNCNGKTILDEAVLGGRNYYVESLWDYACRESKSEDNDVYKYRKTARAVDCCTF